MYIENYKTLMKEVEKTQKKEKIACLHGLEELILLKCPYFPKPLIYSVHLSQNSSGI